MKHYGKRVAQHKAFVAIALIALATAIFLTWLALQDFSSLSQASVQDKTALSGTLAQMEFTLVGFSFFLLGFIFTQKLNVSSSTSNDSFYRRLMILISSLLMLTMATAYLLVSYVALKSEVLLDVSLFLVFLEGVPMLLAVVYMNFRLR